MKHMGKQFDRGTALGETFAIISYFDQNIDNNPNEEGYDWDLYVEGFDSVEVVVTAPKAGIERLKNRFPKANVTEKGEKDISNTQPDDFEGQPQLTTAVEAVFDFSHLDES